LLKKYIPSLTPLDLVTLLSKIAIIDYGLGNLRSVKIGFEKVGAKITITNDAKIIAENDAIVLAGVGAFATGMMNLEPLVQTIHDQITSGKTLLGICLGLQLLFEESYEGGFTLGLKILKGKVLNLPNSLKVPHIGWNSLKIINENPFIASINNGSYVYFAHSYYAEAKKDNIVSTTDYGIEFPSIVSEKNVFATQFHPEKSGKVGLQILKNFINLLKC